jgi:hypothetical protein
MLYAYEKFFLCNFYKLPVLSLNDKDKTIYDICSHYCTRQEHGDQKL